MICLRTQNSHTGGSDLGQKADHVLDFKGMLSPFSLLKVTGIFREMKKGETLEIDGCDPDIQTGLLKVLPPSSYELEMAASANNGPLYSISLKKTANT